MPLGGIYSYFRVRSGKPLPPKNRRYRAMIVMQLLISVVTLAVAEKNGVVLFAGNWPAMLIWLICGLYLAFIAVRLNTAWYNMNAPLKQKPRLLFPKHPQHIWYS